MTTTFLARTAGVLFGVSAAHVSTLVASGQVTPAVIAGYAAAGVTILAVRTRS